jgi:uncharacterized protein YxjI
MAGWNPAAANLMSSMENQGVLLMKMKILSLGKNYDVMDKEQRVLAHIGLDAQQNMTGSLVGSAVGSVAGGYVGRFVQRSMTYTYDVKDAGENLALQIKKGQGGNRTQFTIVDPMTGAVAGTIDMKRSLFGGLKATWVAPNGQPLMLTKGNIMRRKYAINNGAGQELGRVRHKILAIRDVWELDLNPGINHLYSAIFAVILDFEKKM